jgi:hypothetical protein
MAWIGPTKAVLHYLATVHADQGADGSFIISGEQVATGLGGDEVVVPDGTVYFVHGERKNLAAGLSSTSQGVGGIKAFDQGSGYRAPPPPRAAATPPWEVAPAGRKGARKKRTGPSSGSPSGNPVATAQEMVDKIKAWLVANNLSSADIQFLTPEEWNAAHADGRWLVVCGLPADWQIEIKSGFMVVAEGTRFNRDLAGENGRSGVRTYQQFSGLLDANGWWLEPFTGWAFHVVPDDGKMRLSNPASVDTLERYTQAELEAMPSIESGHFDELKVVDGKFRWWVSRMTRADGETHPISVEEQLPRQGWQVVHKYGVLENPARHVHRESFKGYAASAVRHMQLAQEAVAARDKGRAWNMIRHAECDVRQAYTEASYATRGPEDPALNRMSGQLVKVHREILAVMQDLRRAQNPATGRHIGELAQHLERAREELNEARTHARSGNLPDAAKVGGRAETSAILAVLQVEYLMDHAGETVAWDEGQAITIPTRAKLDAIRHEARNVGQEAQQIYMNAVCQQPRPWVEAVNQGRTLH